MPKILLKYCGKYKMDYKLRDFLPNKLQASGRKIGMKMSTNKYNKVKVLYEIKGHSYIDLRCSNTFITCSKCIHFSSNSSW